MEDRNENPNYYAIIPANVRYDNRLSPNSKLLYGEITALANKSGFCWATNRYFAELYQVSKETVSRWVNELVNCNYITSEIIRNENNQVEKRIIKLIIPINDFNNTGTNKKINTGIIKKVIENSTSKNSTSNECITEAKPRNSTIQFQSLSQAEKNNIIKKNLTSIIENPKQTSNQIKLDEHYRIIDNFTNNSELHSHLYQFIENCYTIQKERRGKMLGAKNFAKRLQDLKTKSIDETGEINIEYAISLVKYTIEQESFYFLGDSLLKRKVLESKTQNKQRSKNSFFDICADHKTESTADETLMETIRRELEDPKLREENASFFADIIKSKIERGLFKPTEDELIELENCYGINREDIL